MFDRGGGDKESGATPATTDVAPGRDVPSSGGPVDRALETAGHGEKVAGAVLHTDGVAAEAAGALNAHAFAAGQDVYFGAGQYSPGTTEGQALIAHEMKHVDQAAGVEAPTPGNYSVASSSAPQESEARAWAGGGLSGGSMMAEPATIYRAEIGVGVADNLKKHGKNAEEAAAGGGRDGAQFNLLAARGAGEDDKDPLQAFRLAVVAGSKAQAITKWGKVPATDKVKLLPEKDTLLRAMQVMGAKSLDVLKDVGVDPTTDERFAQEILWHGSSKAWMDELKTQGWLTKFLQGNPRRAKLDKKSVEHLEAYTEDAGGAQDAFEKAFTDLKTGNVTMAGGPTTTLTFHGSAWDQSRIQKSYKALRKSKIPPSHFTGSTGIWLSGQVEDPTGSAAVAHDWGYYDGSGGIVLPDYVSFGGKDTGGGRDHNMVGAKKQAGPAMEHFEASMLHEVGHLVADQTGEADWARNKNSPVHMETATADDIKTELWSSKKSKKPLKGIEPVSEADAQLFLEQEAMGTDAYASTTFGADSAKQRVDFDINLDQQYENQNLYKFAKTQMKAKDDAYTKPYQGSTTTTEMYTYMSRGVNSYVKYKKEAWDKRVSEYSLASPIEWFAEQYSYYMSTGGQAKFPAIKTKMIEVMKKTDKSAGTPAMTSPGAGAGAGSPGGAATTGGAEARTGGPPPMASPGSAPPRGHRFHFSW